MAGGEAVQNDRSTINVIIVVDGGRIAQSAFLHLALSSYCGGDFQYFFAVPDDQKIPDWSELEICRNHVFFRIPSPNLRIGTREYRIINKIIAMKMSPVSDALLIDSDTFFHAAPNPNFIFRDVPCASPEHNPPPFQAHQAIWNRISEHLELPEMKMCVMTGSKKYSVPYFNAGLVVSKSCNEFGATWERVALELLDLHWVPRKDPYLDQIALPFAMAHESGGTIDFNNVLPDLFNQNLFHFVPIADVPRSAVMYHHHDRISILRSLFPDKFSRAVRDFQMMAKILPDMAYREYDKYSRLQEVG